MHKITATFALFFFNFKRQNRYTILAKNGNKKPDPAAYLLLSINALTLDVVSSHLG